MPIRNTADWVNSLRPQVRTLDNDALAARMESATNLILIDIRELQELLLKGAIPDAHHVPRGMLEFWADPASSYFRELFDEAGEYVVYCAGGGRSVLATLALMEMGYANVAHLGGGFNGWAADGRPVEDVAKTSKWVRRERAG